MLLIILYIYMQNKYFYLRIIFKNDIFNFFIYNCYKVNNFIINNKYIFI